VICVIAVPPALTDHPEVNSGEKPTLPGLSRQIFEQIVASSAEGVLVADAQSPNLKVVYVNDAYQALTGYDADELIGRGWLLLERATDGSVELELLRSAVGQATPCQVVIPDVRKDGTTWFSQVNVTPLYHAPGELRYFLCRCSPVGRTQEDAALEVGLLQRELGRVRQKIQSLNRIEAVTGVLKFESFLETAQRDLRMARRDGRAVSILLFDVAELDVYRRTFGPKAADSCLRMVAAQVASTLKRAGDLCARHGETGIVALVHGHDADQARVLAQKIAENVRGLGLHNPRGKAARYIGVAIGVSSAAADTKEDIEAVIERARSDLQANGPVAEARDAS
jgi:diguanylate cyclase (GGDEF)-like protein/PAS domain S-box-containing protein